MEGPYCRMGTLGGAWAALVTFSIDNRVGMSVSEHPRHARDGGADGPSVLTSGPDAVTSVRACNTALGASATDLPLLPRISSGEINAFGTLVALRTVSNVSGKRASVRVSTRRTGTSISAIRDGAFRTRHCGVYGTMGNSGRLQVQRCSSMSSRAVASQAGRASRGRR